MDAVKIEIKDEFVHQDEELQIKEKYIAISSIENTNISHEQVHIKNEPIDHGSNLLSTENANLTNSSMIKQDVSDAENQEARKKGIETQKSSTDNAILDLKKPLSNLHDCIQERTFLKSETIEMKTNLKTEVKQENYGEFPAREKVRFDLITSKEFNYPFAKFELIKMKTDVKTEAKEQPFENFEAKEQSRIDFIKSKDFHSSFNESEHPTQKTDLAIKRKIKEEPNESNMPLKKFKHDCIQSNIFVKAETIEKERDLKTEIKKGKTDFEIKHKIKEELNECCLSLKKLKSDCIQSNPFAKSETIEKKRDLKTEIKKEKLIKIEQSPIEVNLVKDYFCDICKKISTIDHFPCKENKKLTCLSCQRSFSDLLVLASHLSCNCNCRSQMNEVFLKGQGWNGCLRNPKFDTLEILAIYGKH